MSGTHKGVSGIHKGVSDGGGWVAGCGLNPPLGLFGPATSPRSAMQPLTLTRSESLRDISLTLGSISDACLPCSALHGSPCLSHEFTWSAKLALEKQTSQAILVMTL